MFLWCLRCNICQKWNCTRMKNVSEDRVHSLVALERTVPTIVPEYEQRPHEEARAKTRTADDTPCGTGCRAWRTSRSTRRRLLKNLAPHTTRCAAARDGRNAPFHRLDLSNRLDLLIGHVLGARRGYAVQQFRSRGDARGSLGGGGFGGVMRVRGTICGVSMSVRVAMKDRAVCAPDGKIYYPRSVGRRSDRTLWSILNAMGRNQRLLSICWIRNRTDAVGRRVELGR